MSTITYGVVAETYLLGSQTRNAYGIVAYADANQDGTATVVASAHDITPDRYRAEQLADKCNRGNLSLCHFDDVIEDFLAE